MTDETQKQDHSPEAEPDRDASGARTQPDRDEQATATSATQPPGGFGIVGIGASAGGLDALQALLDAMPADTGLGVVIVPHLDPTHTSLMPQLLASHTDMTVHEAEDGMPVAPNRVYVIPPGYLLQIDAGVLRLKEGPTKGASALRAGGAIDAFLRSLAADQGEFAIGVVLSGTGSQGTLGLREIKNRGGLTMAQDPTTAQFDAMPLSAINAGAADRILAPGAIGAQLADYARHAADSGLWTPPAAADALDDPSRDQLTAIIALMRARTKYDFSYYRKNMLMRRVRRRMGLCHIEGLAAYLAHLREDSGELVHLFRDLLIGVTGFFRDPEVFDLLYHRVLDPLVGEHVRLAERDAPLRIWVPGCATGEEAYTIGILLTEAFERHKSLPDMQIFATDLDEQALETARQGVYPKGIAADLTEERLRRFFTRDKDECFRVEKRLREVVVFAPQNLVTDAPFSRLDLISCRNLLIYLEPAVQKRVIGLFHFALKPQGFLLLGPSETVGQQSMLFETVSKRCRLFRRSGSRPQEFLPVQAPGGVPAVRTVEAETPFLPSTDLSGLAQRTLLTEYGAAAVLINRRYEILYLFGPTVDYLELPSGRPNLDLTAMVRQGLRSRVRTACHKAFNEQRAVTVDDARVRRTGGAVRVRMRVTPLRDAAGPEGLLLVSFRDLEQPQPSPAANAPEGEEERALAHQLESELRATREDLQTTIEELESANEELKASNEEAMSMNEELQSANEELETSKEELQSLNEELTTVNNQLEDKVQELEHSNNDISNLLASTEIATTFLDTDMRVKRFTPRAAEVLNLRPGDIGRPMLDLSPNVTDTELLADARQVLDRLTPQERDLQGDGDSRYLRRIQPYRTQENRIEGVVVTYVDITRHQRAEQALRASEARFRMLFERSPMCLLEQDWSGVLSCLAERSDSDSGGTALADWARAHPAEAAKCRHRLTIRATNAAALALAGLADGDADPVAVEHWFPLAPAPGFLALLDDLLRGRAGVQELEVRTRDGRSIPVLTHMVPASGHRDTLARVLVAIIDISARKAMEQTLAEREQRLSAIVETVVDGIIGVDADGRITHANAAAGRLFTSTADELTGQPLSRLLTPAPAWQPAGDILACIRLAAHAAPQRPLSCEGYRNDGSTFLAEVSSAEIEHTGIFVLVVRDISERRALERQAVEAGTREQQRIGQDIHDGLGQQLAAAGMMATSLARRLDRAGRSESTEAMTLAKHLEQAARDARDIVTGLRPIGIAPDALPKALTALAAQISQSDKVTCHLSCDEGLAIDDSDAATHLYRIAQEATSNAIRHGGAGRIDIELHRDGSRLHLTVHDDGTWSETGPAPGGGHGLQIMSYRAGILGGTLSVGPADAGGTLLRCEVPWPPTPAVP